ncbi:MAG: rhomboid family intramembrane serine protease [Myxococcota bacterium]|nr:rhomboid family intramembrane serine protease [Myxococcota bacterium]
MSGAPEAGPPDRFPLRGGRPPVALHETGFRHPRPGPWGGEVFTPYAGLTHVAAGARGLRIGTRRGVLSLRRGDFLDPDAALQLGAALRARVADLPDGPARLARMEALDRRLVHPGRRPLSRIVVLACVVAFGLQLWLFPDLALAGMFSADLVRTGEWWRLVTANLLHGGVAHLLLNIVALGVLGDLLERQVRSAATGFVMATSGLGAMLGSLVAGYPSALGASGVVAGVVAALLVREIRTPDRIPAPWRIPRGLILLAIVGETAVLAFVPAVAHAAHAGGFVAGGAATLLLPGPGRSRRWLGLVDAAAALAVLAAVGITVTHAVWPDAETARRRAERLLELPDPPPGLLNNAAWRIATSEDPEPELLELAERMARRAVDATGRRDPNFLDTLAEVYFQEGERRRALAVIEEAIALAPEERYFREQRRRFLGERDPDDRPAPPESLPPPAEPGPPIPERPRLRA